MTSSPTWISNRIDPGESSTVDQEAPVNWFAGKRVALIGRLGSMTRKEASALIARLGGCVVRSDAHHVDCLVLGADAFPFDVLDLIPTRLHEDVTSGQVTVLPETEFWQQLGLIEPEFDSRRLYSPAMLADLLKVSITTIRGWARRGLIVPAREIHRLPYFDFQEVVTAQRLAEMLNTGMNSSAIAARLQSLAQFVPGVDRPLAQLSIIVDGRDFLLRTGSGLIDTRGQRCFDFADPAELKTCDVPDDTGTLLPFPHASEPTPPGHTNIPGNERSEAIQQAIAFEEAGCFDEAIESYRLAMLTGERSSEGQFALAELLYRRGDLAAARERYYCALEMDPDFIEARANLGCVLAEEGQITLAIAAYQGALERFPNYAEAHYHLARLLDQNHESGAAESHWREFARLAPQSPWVDEACDRLGLLRI